MSEDLVFQKSQREEGMTVEAQDSPFLKGADSTDISERSESPNKEAMFLYGVEDNPPPLLSITLGFQQYLTMFGSTIAIPLLMAGPLCVGDDNVSKSEIIGTIFFVSGICTLLQSTFGSRLPIVQGGTMAYLAPAFAILSLPQWQCPVNMQNSESLNESLTSNYSSSNLSTGGPEVWKSRMREIQGAIIMSSLLQILVGFFGVVGFVLHLIGPLTIAPTISLIGISLFKDAADFCSIHWGIAMMTICLMILFSQYMKVINIPIPGCKWKHGCRVFKIPLFKLFPMVLAIVTSWIVCVILTYTNVFPSDPNHRSYRARTDSKLFVIEKAQWFRLPYPGQWGMPTFSTASVLGMLAGVVAGLMESIGDYYACARIAGAPPPPVHAINRGVFMEGIGCMLAGWFGTGTATTSYSENIGAIGITRVGSRRVIQFGAVIMLVLGTMGKFGAFFVTIPDPIVGGMFMVMFGMVAAVGISNLQFVDLNSTRNLFILGFSLFFGLSFPQWMKMNPGIIDTGIPILTQLITVLLSTGMFVGGAIGLFLDNTIPGTKEERGIVQWRNYSSDGSNCEHFQNNFKTYQLPFGNDALMKIKLFRWFPISPSFTGRTTALPDKCRKRKLSENKKSEGNRNHKDEFSQ